MHFIKKNLDSDTNNPSTAHALIETTKKIKQACDAENYNCRVSLDLQKVFDTVNHSIL